MTDKSLQSPYLLRLRPYVSGGQVPTQPPSLLIGRCLHHPPLQSTPPLKLSPPLEAQGGNLGSCHEQTIFFIYTGIYMQKI